MSTSNGGTYECRLSIAAGAKTVDLGYRLQGQRLFAEVMCVGCTDGWLAFGFARSPGVMVGAVAVIGWLGGGTGRRLTEGGGGVGAYRLDGRYSAAVVRLDAASEAAILEDTSIAAQDGALVLRFTTTLGAGSLPPTPISNADLLAAYGSAASGTFPSFHGANRGGITANLLRGFVQGMAPPPQAPASASLPPSAPLNGSAGVAPLAPPLPEQLGNLQEGQEGGSGAMLGISVGIPLALALIAAFVLAVWIRRKRLKLLLTNGLKLTTLPPPPTFISSTNLHDDHVSASADGAPERISKFVELDLDWEPHEDGGSAPPPPLRPPSKEMLSEGEEGD